MAYQKSSLVFETKSPIKFTDVETLPHLANTLINLETNSYLYYDNVLRDFIIENVFFFS